MEHGDTVEGDDERSLWRELARHMTPAMWVRAGFLALLALGVVGAMLIIAVLVTMIVR
jgi:hypothetical protein